MDKVDWVIIENRFHDCRFLVLISQTLAYAGGSYTGTYYFCYKYCYVGLGS